jgi:hypothetical protein
MCVVFAKTRPAGTAKNAKKGVIGWNLEQTSDRCLLSKNRSRHAIDEIARSQESLIPITKWKRGMRKQSKTSFDKMSMFTLCNTILLRRMRAGYAVNNTRALKITMELVVFTTPIGLNCLDLRTQKALNIGLESIEHILNIRLVLKKIDPTKTCMIIDKANIIFITSRGGDCRTPNIGVN